MSDVKGVEPADITVTIANSAKVPQWYAVQTRAKHEKKVGTELWQKGLMSFAPTIREAHRWTDRRKIVEVPLFRCYTFVRAVLSPDVRQAVVQTPGVLRFVGFGEGPVPIPDGQIESIQTVLASNAPFSSCPVLKEGDKVRVRGGALDGVEGVLMARNGDRKLVISIDLIQQSMAVALEGYDIDPV
jgi:transcription termination/antitermination protein NusG